MRHLCLRAGIATFLTVLLVYYHSGIFLRENRNESTRVSQLAEKVDFHEDFRGEPEAPMTTTARIARATRITRDTNRASTTTTPKRSSRNNTWTPFYDRKRPDGKPDLPRILFWTTVHGGWHSGLKEEGVAELEYQKCSHRCYIANDRRMLSVSDAVVFYGRDSDPEHVPEDTAPFQEWVYWSIKPPWHTPVALFKDLNNTINWTMTYRLDSDVLNTYARITKLRPAEHPYSKQSIKNAWKGKSKTAAWAVSSCKTSGKREHYVEELQKHLYIDVYGKCGEYKWPQDLVFNCNEMFAKKYFFYLSFENSICKDYVTEKLYTNLLYDIIPVVYGGANYSQVAPPGSYIDALSFESPMHLAHYLKKVAKDYNLYKRYFEWKDKYKVERMRDYDFCNLCQKLHSDDFEKTAVVPDIYR